MAASYMIEYDLNRPIQNYTDLMLVVSADHRPALPATFLWALTTGEYVTNTIQDFPTRTV